MERQEDMVQTISRCIVEQLTEQRITEPVYAVILLYGTREEDELCPWVAVGTQRERAAILMREPEPYRVLWDGQFLESYQPVEALLEDGGFLERCAQWKETAHAGEHGELRVTALMQRICFSLLKIRWETIFPITEDFVVTACRDDGDWLMDNLYVLAGPDKVDRFLEQGYLFAGAPDQGDGE